MGTQLMAIGLLKLQSIHFGLWIDYFLKKTILQNEDGNLENGAGFSLSKNISFLWVEDILVIHPHLMPR